MNLKLELEQIDLNHSSVNLDALIEEMVLQIGSTDPVLRDELIYTTFDKLVMEDHLSETKFYLSINDSRILIRQRRTRVQISVSLERKIP